MGVVASYQYYDYWADLITIAIIPILLVAGGPEFFIS
jgi:hypothetical protein